MKKVLFLILFLISLSQSYTQLSLVQCFYEGYPTNGYVGVYRSYYGNIYNFVFRYYCPYTYTIQ